jgi:hypothetical protein
MSPLHFQPPPGESADTAVPSPTRDPNDPEYQKECHEALLPFINELCAQAMMAGWDISAVDYSLMVLSAQNMRRRAEDI